MGKKILVVDNNLFILECMSDLLKKEGYQVLTARDGLTALDIIKIHIPDIIFIDLIMPNIDGKKLCQIIRRIPKLKDTSIAILSAVATEEKIDLAQLGADFYIAKERLGEMARHILAVLAQCERRNLEAYKEQIMIPESVSPREITKELLSIKKHFEIILESMSEGILEVTAERRIVFANSTAISMIGMSEEKLLGANFVELFNEFDRERVEQILKTVNQPQTITEETPLNLSNKLITMNIMLVNDHDHKAIIMLRDVTDQKRMEAQLLAAQKIEAIGTLAAGIAHDFNNLLAGILGCTSLILLDIRETHPHYDKLKEIERLVKNGASLTSQLLGYARKGKYEIKLFNLNQIVKDTSETFGRTRKEITIHRELAEDLFVIEADQRQIEQVLFNLYGNAADAMPGGGDLILKTRNCTHEEMQGNLFQPKPCNYVLLTVTDTGIGMDKKTMKRIFDPFFTTKEMGRGTGLGLASVYGIIKGHGGYIDVSSEKGQGTTFKVYLPGDRKNGFGNGKNYQTEEKFA